MKKRFLIIFLLAFFITTVQASEWKEYNTKSYIDVSSIEKLDNESFKKNDLIYSFWIKMLNDKSPYFIDLEKNYNKKIWYSMDKLLINCKNKTIAVKSSIFYDLKGYSIDSYDISNQILLRWNSIAPDSRGEALYYGICSP